MTTDYVTLTLTRDELATLEYLVMRPEYQDIPEVVQLANVVGEVIWAANNPRDE